MNNDEKILQILEQMRSETNTRFDKFESRRTWIARLKAIK